MNVFPEPVTPEQDLVGIAAFQSLGQLADRARLIAGERELRHEIEAVVHRGHRNPQSSYRGPTLDIGAAFIRALHA